MLQRGHASCNTRIRELHICTQTPVTSVMSKKEQVPVKSRSIYLSFQQSRREGNVGMRSRLPMIGGSSATLKPSLVLSGRLMQSQSTVQVQKEQENRQSKFIAPFCYSFSNVFFRIVTFLNNSVDTFFCEYKLRFK